MAIKIKWGSTSDWFDVWSGKAYVKWGGTGWTSPQAIKVKQGALGAGVWIDSGYTGKSSVPSTPWIQSWDYSNIILKWNAGSGGAPVAKYFVKVYNYWGTKTGTIDVGNATSCTIPVTWDWAYQFKVYSQTSQGVDSGDSGVLKILIGHPYQATYGYVERVRAYDSGNLVNVNPRRDYLFRDEAFSVYLGDDVVIKEFSWQDLRVHIPYLGNIVTTGYLRTVNLLMAGVWQGWALDDGLEAVGAAPAGTNILSSSSYAWYALPIDPPTRGGNNWWGIGPRGTGWVTAADGRVQYSMYASDVRFDGDQYYQSYEVVSSVAEVGNSYNPAGSGTPVG